ncbi:hypothetical protein G6F59_015506 [Rhizopus arrhizus]|nr:hypothetical protein G6F59_015506 [Rhizopus arrhizus]
MQALADAAHPDRRGQAHQGQQEQCPVALERQLAGQEVAVAIHVRIRGDRPAAEVVDVLRVVEHAQHALADHHHDQQRVADELVVGQYLEHQRQASHQDVDHRIQRQAAQVQQWLQMGVALGQLHAHRGQCAGCLEADDHRQQRSELGQQRHPVRHRHGIGHFVDARTA